MLSDINLVFISKILKNTCIICFLRIKERAVMKEIHAINNKRDKNRRSQLIFDTKFEYGFWAKISWTCSNVSVFYRRFYTTLYIKEKLHIELIIMKEKINILQCCTVKKKKNTHGGRASGWRRPGTEPCTLGRCWPSYHRERRRRQLPGDGGDDCGDNDQKTVLEVPWWPRCWSPSPWWLFRLWSSACCLQIVIRDRKN